MGVQDARHGRLPHDCCHYNRRNALRRIAPGAGLCPGGGDRQGPVAHRAGRLSLPAARCQGLKGIRGRHRGPLHPRCEHRRGAGNQRRTRTAARRPSDPRIRAHLCAGRMGASRNEGTRRGRGNPNQGLDIRCRLHRHGGPNAVRRDRARPVARRSPRAG